MAPTKGKGKAVPPRRSPRFQPDKKSSSSQSGNSSSSSSPSSSHKVKPSSPPTNKLRDTIKDVIDLLSISKRKSTAYTLVETNFKKGLLFVGLDDVHNMCEAALQNRRVTVVIRDASALPLVKFKEDCNTMITEGTPFIVLVREADHLIPALHKAIPAWISRLSLEASKICFMMTTSNVANVSDAIRDVMAHVYLPGVL